MQSTMSVDSDNPSTHDGFTNVPPNNNATTNIREHSISVPRSSIHQLLNSNIDETSSSLPISTNSISSASSPSPLQNVALIDSITNSISGTIAEPSKSKAKSRRKSNQEEKVLISTSSPEGIAAASKITPNRIANILINEGPLPIRHLTGHLIDQVPAFGSLSLSKQRRLIMSALESGDLETGCIFEKIGWGQWEAKVVGIEIVKMKIANSDINTNNGNTNPANVSLNDVDETKPSTGSLYTDQTNGSNISFNENTNKIKKSRAQSHPNRRESITSHLAENYKMPTSPTLGPTQTYGRSLHQYGDIDDAIKSSSDDDDDDLGDDDEDDDFNDDINNSYQRSFKISPSPDSPTNTDSAITGKIPNIGTHSVNSSRHPSFAGITKPRKPRSSFNQHTLEVALDEAPIERRESRVSFSNSSNLSRQSFLRTNIVPLISNNNSLYSLHNEDNENAIADDYEDYKLSRDHSSPDSGAVITDEEDWQTQGPSLIKNNRQSSILGSQSSTLHEFRSRNGSQIAHSKANNNSHTIEELAAIALMDMKSV